jgi:hypothetical protein
MHQTPWPLGLTRLSINISNKINLLFPVSPSLLLLLLTDIALLVDGRRRAGLARVFRS